jgi:biopolymer transport protein ExbD
MGMSVGGSDDGGMMMEMNTTPLIDVMLVLIVMLIITIPIQTHAVKLDMPQTGKPPPPVQPEVIDLVVDFDGTLLWNGVQIPNAETLLNYFQEASVKEPQPELHLRPNKLAKYDVVANVLATAQRLHIRNIGIVGNETMDQ